MATGFIERLAGAGAAALIAFAPPVVSAQTQGPYAYVFAAPGAYHCCGDSVGTLQVGGGGEVIFPSGVGVGAELGFLGPWDYFADGGFGVLSLNGSYHFGRHGSRVRPFVTGGWSVTFREGSETLWNLGGGVQYWFRRGLALRLEFRDHIHLDGVYVIDGDVDCENLHYWGVRIGLSFALGGR
jgi:hypothetical protein